MKFTYISPSVLPSRTANSVHVVMQCEALIQAGVAMTLYAKRSVPKDDALLPSIAAAYGADLSRGRVVSFWSRSSRGVNLLIAVMSLWSLLRKPWPDVVLSRNLYASYVLAVIFRRPLLFETHQLEVGVYKYMQHAVMTRSKVVTVVISKKLESYLTQHHGVAPANTLVLHDAAPEGIEPLAEGQRRYSLVRICPQAEGDWKAVCGYFGHLYAGRGVEVIESMAKARPEVLFLLFGGNEQDVNNRREGNRCENVYYVGHVPHPVAQQAMKSVDILLMPYQKNVAIGVSGHDTARWMSPMKMFEYMATGVPIISSNLPVLCEVLSDGENALLVPPDDSKSWVSAVDQLLSDKDLAGSIGARAHHDYKANYTWRQRANRLIETAKTL
jgi:glycosyltransferase involved in cell wall biosynthesis